MGTLTTELTGATAPSILQVRSGQANARIKRAHSARRQDALALVTRPLALPYTRMGAMGVMGVMAAVVPHHGIGMRVLMQYDINAGGTVVNCDILAGVAVLDSGLLVPVLG